MAVDDDRRTERSTTMTWDALHHRGDVLNAVIAEAARRRDGRLPMDVPGVADTFRDELDLVGALQLRWYTRLTGRIDRELAEQPRDLQSAVVTAWREVALEMPGVREVIDRCVAEPVSEGMARAMATATAKERHMLALMAGLVSTTTVDAHGVRMGARLEEAARAGLATDPAPAPDARPEPAGAHRAPGNPRFLRRLKAALAA